MSGPSDQTDSMIPAEKAATKHSAPNTRLLLYAGIIVLAGLLTANFWLIHRNVAWQRQSQLEHHFWVIGQRIYPAQSRGEAFLRLVAAGNREWTGAHLNGLHLEGANLHDADCKRWRARWLT